MSADPVAWLPDGKSSWTDFKEALGRRARREISDYDAHTELAGLRGAGLVAATGNPREPSTLVVTKLQPRAEAVSVTPRPVFHSVPSQENLESANARLRHENTTLRRRVAELERH